MIAREYMGQLEVCIAVGTYDRGRDRHHHDDPQGDRGGCVRDAEKASQNANRGWVKSRPTLCGPATCVIWRVTWRSPGAACSTPRTSTIVTPGRTQLPYQTSTRDGGSLLAVAVDSSNVTRRHEATGCACLSAGPAGEPAVQEQPVA